VASLACAGRPFDQVRKEAAPPLGVAKLGFGFFDF